MRDPNAAPTVRIVYPANKRAGYANIPAADFDPAIHTLYEPDAKAVGHEAKTDDGLTVGKGPGGRWFVKRGGRVVTGPYPDKAAAEAAAEGERD